MNKLTCEVVKKPNYLSTGCPDDGRARTCDVSFHGFVCGKVVWPNFTPKIDHTSFKLISSSSSSSLIFCNSIDLKTFDWMSGNHISVVCVAAWRLIAGNTTKNFSHFLFQLKMKLVI